MDLDWTYLGCVPYDEALRLQHALRDARLRGDCGDVLLLLEHPPTVTLGRRGSDADLRRPRAEIVARGVTVEAVDRGGLATYHGPGQLVGYPIVHLGELRRGSFEFVRDLAEALAAVVRGQGVEAVWDEARPGLWVGDDKLAALGLHVHHGVTTHGFALNVRPDLSAFDLIVPCGLSGVGVTSLAELLGAPGDLPALAPEVAEAVAARLGCAPRRVPPEDVRARVTP